MPRVTMLCVLATLGATSCATFAGPTSGEPHVPCSSLFGVRHSEAAVMAMGFQEAQQTLANARVIEATCGK